jgi:hypothetical protein
MKKMLGVLLLMACVATLHASGLPKDKLTKVGVPKKVVHTAVQPKTSKVHPKQMQVMYAWFLCNDGCWRLYAGVETTYLDPITGVGIPAISWEHVIPGDDGFNGLTVRCNYTQWDNYC